MASSSASSSSASSSSQVDQDPIRIAQAYLSLPPSSRRSAAPQDTEIADPAADPDPADTGAPNHAQTEGGSSSSGKSRAYTLLDAFLHGAPTGLGNGSAVAASAGGGNSAAAKLPTPLRIKFAESIVGDLHAIRSATAAGADSEANAGQAPVRSRECESHSSVPLYRNVHTSLSSLSLIVRLLALKVLKELGRLPGGSAPMASSFGLKALLSQIRLPAKRCSALHPPPSAATHEGESVNGSRSRPGSGPSSRSDSANAAGAGPTAEASTGGMVEEIRDDLVPTSTERRPSSSSTLSLNSLKSTASQRTTTTTTNLNGPSLSRSSSTSSSTLVAPKASSAAGAQRRSSTSSSKSSGSTSSAGGGAGAGVSGFWRQRKASTSVNAGPGLSADKTLPCSGHGSAKDEKCGMTPLDWEINDVVLRCLNNTLFLHEQARALFASAEVGGGALAVEMLEVSMRVFGVS